MFPQAPFDLVAVAASTGGIVAIKQILDRLPAHFPVPIAVVQHLSPNYPSQLPQVLGWRTPLPVRFAEDGERLRAGSVIVAPPDRHLTITSHGRFGLEKSARRNYVRPSADRLFATAAAVFGARVLGVVLTGMGADGASGAIAIRASGGMVIVQDPEEAEAPYMPRTALEACGADLVLPTEAIAHALRALTLVRGSREMFSARRAPEHPGWHV